jgi:hypothetical protein
LIVIIFGNVQMKINATAILGTRLAGPRHDMAGGPT